MYESQRNDFEQTKRCAIQPSNNFLQNTSTRNIFDTPNDMLDQPSRARQDTSAGTDISPVTPAQANNFWPPQRERNMFEGVGDMMQQKKSGSGITGGNKGAISFGATKSSMFNAIGNPSNTLRNLVLSPVKRQASSHLRPLKFSMQLNKRIPYLEKLLQSQISKEERHRSNDFASAAILNTYFGATGGLERM